MNLVFAPWLSWIHGSTTTLRSRRRVWFSRWKKLNQTNRSVKIHITVYASYDSLFSFFVWSCNLILGRDGKAKFEHMLLIKLFWFWAQSDMTNSKDSGTEIVSLCKTNVTNTKKQWESVKTLQKQIECSRFHAYFLKF